jgi:hypothetical protein
MAHRLRGIEPAERQVRSAGIQSAKHSSLEPVAPPDLPRHDRTHRTVA